MLKGHKVVTLWLKVGPWNHLFESHVSSNGYAHNRVWQYESALSFAMVSGCKGQPLLPMASPLHMVFGLTLALTSFMDILMDLSYSLGPSRLVCLVSSVLDWSWFGHVPVPNDHFSIILSGGLMYQLRMLYYESYLKFRLTHCVIL